MPEKTFKQVCECKNCGNEAEMQITCTLAVDENVTAPAKAEKPVEETTSEKHVQGRSVCSHCGNEADLWLEVE